MATKLLERIKLDGKVEEFYQAIKEQSEILIANINDDIDAYVAFFNNEVLFLNDVKKEIATLINSKLQVKIPDRYIENIMVANAEKEKKSRKKPTARKKK